MTYYVSSGTLNLTKPKPVSDMTYNVFGGTYMGSVAFV